FIAQVRPDLPPVFMGQEMTLAAMGARARSGSGPVAARADVETLRVLADHHCVDPEHACSGGPCAGFRQLLDDLEEALSLAERAAANHNLWLSALGELLSDPPRVDPTGASAEIGRASCRERVESSGGAGTGKRKRDGEDG